MSNTWETGVVLPGTTIFTLAGLQPNTSYLLRFVTLLYSGGKNVIVVCIRWKPATGLRFSDVTINTTEIHNHEVAREIHSPEHDLEDKDKNTKEVHKYQTSKQIKKEKLFKKVRRHRPAKNAVNNTRIKNEPLKTLSENEESSLIKKGEVVSDVALFDISI